MKELICKNYGHSETLEKINGFSCAIIESNNNNLPFKQYELINTIERRLN